MKFINYTQTNKNYLIFHKLSFNEVMRLECYVCNSLLLRLFCLEKLGKN